MKFSIDLSAVPAKPAGAGRYAIALASGICEAMSASDCALLVANSKAATFWQGLAPCAEVVASVPSNRVLRLLYEQTLFGRLLNKNKVDVHHGIHYTMPEGFKGAKVVTVHDMTLLEHPEWHERSKVILFTRALAVAAKRADFIICPSNFTADKLRNLLNPRGDVVVIYHGVDQRGIGGETRSAPRLPDQVAGAPYILFVGTIEPRKDLPTLISAFERVAEKNKDLALVVAGQVGWKSAQAISRIEDSRLRERIFRLDYVDEATLGALYTKARAFVYPSFEEGFGLPVLEAMRSGVPVITTKGTSMAEVARGGALLFEPGNYEELTEAIQSVIDGTVSSEELVAKGLEVSSDYTWESSVKAHLALYRLAAERN